MFETFKVKREKAADQKTKKGRDGEYLLQMLRLPRNVFYRNT